MKFLVSAALAQPLGHWTFIDDGTSIELRQCVAGAPAFCGVITRLPKSAAALAAEDRKALCGALLLTDLRPAKAKEGEQARLDGSVVDIDSMAQGGKASQYAASFVVVSEMRARLDVKGTFGLIVERHLLIRALAPNPVCK